MFSAQLFSSIIIFIGIRVLYTTENFGNNLGSISDEISKSVKLASECP